MKRAAAVLAFLALAAIVAPLALRAQEPPGEDQLDELIKTLRKSLGVAEARAKEKKPLAFVTHIYDIRDLTHHLEDHPADQENLVPSGGFGFGFSEGEAFEPMPFYEGDAIADMIRDNIVPDSWGELQSVDVRYQNGMLIVRHTPAVHERIADLLDILRSRSGSQVTVEFRLLRIPDRELRAILDGGGAVLTPEAEKRLDAAIAAKRAEVVRSGRVAMTNTQRVAVRDLSQVSYMQDYDVEIAQSAAIGDPIVQTFYEGFIGDVRPTIAGDGGLVVLEVRATSARLVRPMEAVTTPLGDIQIPRLEMMRVQNMLGMPLGRSAVVGGACSDGDADALVLVVTPTAVRPRAK